MSSARDILIVEDNSPARQIMARILRECGHFVRVACDGAEALRSMREELPLLVVLDLLMPICDGWTVRRQMLEDPVLRRVPVIIVTGVDVPHAGLSALRVDGALRKPFTRDELVGLVEYVLVEAA